MKLAKSTMSKHQLAFMIWRDLVKRSLNEEKHMGKIVDKLLKAAGMQVFQYFSLWKLDTFNDIERRRTIKKNGILNAMMEVLDYKYRNHLKSGFAGIAKDSMNTNAKKKIIAKLGIACFGRIRAAFDNWKYDTFAKLKAEVERKKAKCIDTFVRNGMSPIQKAFLKWAAWNRLMSKIEFGEQIKAGFSLTSLLTRYLRTNKEKYLRFTWRQMDKNDDKTMSTAFNKMIRAAGVNVDRAFLAWRMFTLNADRIAAK